MRLVRFIVNMLLLAVSYFLVTCVTIGCYSLVAYQADDKAARISITDNEENVWFLDAYSYWVDDIGTNVTKTDLPSPKLRTANLFDWGWWKTAGTAVDTYFVNPLVAIIKPIITPVSCANEIKTYYGKDLSDFEAYINASNESVTSFESMALTYYDVVVTTATIEENGKKIKYISVEELKKYEDVFVLDYLVEQDRDANGIKDIYDIADNYNYFYQLMFKIHKYNLTDEAKITESNPEGFVYYKWYNKYVIDTEDGKMLKPSVYSLYALNYINLILAIGFTWTNCIGTERAEDGTIRVRNNVFDRFRNKRRKKKEKKEKDAK